MRSQCRVIEAQILQPGIRKAGATGSRDFNPRIDWRYALTMKMRGWQTMEQCVQRITEQGNECQAQTKAADRTNEQDHLCASAFVLGVHSTRPALRLARAAAGYQRAPIEIRAMRDLGNPFELPSITGFDGLDRDEAIEGGGDMAQGPRKVAPRGQFEISADRFKGIETGIGMDRAPKRAVARIEQSYNGLNIMRTQFRTNQRVRIETQNRIDDFTIA